MFKEPFPALRVGENRQQYAMRLAGYNRRKEAYERQMAANNIGTVTK